VTVSLGCSAQQQGRQVRGLRAAAHL